MRSDVDEKRITDLAMDVLREGKEGRELELAIDVLLLRGELARLREELAKALADAEATRSSQEQLQGLQAEGQRLQQAVSDTEMSVQILAAYQEALDKKVAETYPELRRLREIEAKARAVDALYDERMEIVMLRTNTRDGTVDHSCHFVALREALAKQPNTDEPRTEPS